MSHALTSYINKCLSLRSGWQKEDSTSVEKTWEFFVLSEKLSGNAGIHLEKIIDTSVLTKFWASPESQRVDKLLRKWPWN